MSQQSEFWRRYGVSITNHFELITNECQVRSLSEEGIKDLLGVLFPEDSAERVNFRVLLHQAQWPTVSIFDPIRGSNVIVNASSSLEQLKEVFGPDFLYIQAQESQDKWVRANLSEANPIVNYRASYSVMAQCPLKDSPVPVDTNSSFEECRAVFGPDFKHFEHFEGGHWVKCDTLLPRREYRVRHKKRVLARKVYLAAANRKARKIFENFLAFANKYIFPMLSILAILLAGFAIYYETPSKTWFAVLILATTVYLPYLCPLFFYFFYLGFQKFRGLPTKKSKTNKPN